MNKNIVDNEIQSAYEAINKYDIADKNGVVDNAFRGQISSFGAAVTMGSLTSAIAFFAEQGSSTVEKNKLLYAIIYVLKDNRGKNLKDKDIKSLFDYADKNKGAKEEILNAALAIKLALNLYTLKK